MGVFFEASQTLKSARRATRRKTTGWRGEEEERILTGLSENASVELVLGS